MATGFHGGGGCHREAVSTRPEDLRHPAYAGSDRRVTKMRNTGGLCGALAGGVMIIGYLFGRRVPEDDVTCASEVTFELHKRFEETLGSKVCSVLRPFYMKVTADPSRDVKGNCGEMYFTGAKLTVEVILRAREICPLCPELMFPVM
jgi:C_GCAxxG_C_C family probable redox protein